MNIAIIGTRKVSEDKLKELSESMLNFIKHNNIIVNNIYSGNADGVDQIANQFGKKCIVWLPWTDYNSENLTDQIRIIPTNDYRYDDLLDTMFKHYEETTSGVKSLIRRNAFIILGNDKYPPVDLVFWYTGKGIKGGTAYGVKIAKRYGIRTVEFK